MSATDRWLLVDNRAFVRNVRQKGLYVHDAGTAVNSICSKLTGIKKNKIKQAAYLLIGDSTLQGMLLWVQNDEYTLSDMHTCLVCP